MTSLTTPFSESLTWQEVVAFAEAGHCWVCGRTGFKKLSQHLAMKHGLPADVIRETYGLSWTQSLCTPEYASEVRGMDNLEKARQATIDYGSRQPARSRLQQQTRDAMTEVATRPNVLEGLRQRNRDPEYNALRAEGLRRSALAAEQRAKARQKRWSK